MTARLFQLLTMLCLVLATSAQALSLNGDNGVLGRSLGGGLPAADQAIKVSAQPDWAHRQILARFTMMDNVYLYKHRLSFTLLDEQGQVLRPLPLPELRGGVTKNDDIYGRVTVFYDHLDVVLPLASLPATVTRLKIDYQGCIEDRLCYPPQSRTFMLPAPDKPGLTAPSTTKTPTTKASNTKAPTPDAVTANVAGMDAAPEIRSTGTEPGFVDTLLSQDANSFSTWIQDRDLALVLGLFFLGGILLAFTPCVFPMLPILSGIIAGESRPSARRGFLLSLAYVLGMAIPYTLAGLLVALFGAGMNLQFLLQQPAAIITSAVIFVLLALSMFGLYELQLPERLRSRLGNAGPQGGGGLPGAALLGAISALVVSPCVTPILAGALIYVAGSGDALTGALSLFVLALGMGLPLIIVGTGGAHLLPRAGQWMDDVKRFFGVVMLGIAIWLLGRIISEVLVLALYGLLVMIYGIQLGALEPTPQGGSRSRRGLAVVLALYGAIMLVGAAAGGNNPWRPLAPFGTGRVSAAPASATGPSALATSALPGQWQTLHGKAALAAALHRSARAGRPVLVDFFAEWCVACKELEEHTLSNTQVLQAMNHFDLYRVDITAITPENRALMSQYHIFGLPALVFFDTSGQEIKDARILGAMGPEQFLEHLDRTVTPALNSGG